MSARSSVPAARKGATPDPPGSGPVRTCIGCRVRGAIHSITARRGCGRECRPDPQRCLPGRGAWLHPDLGCLDVAERRRAFGRALRVTDQLDTTGVRDFLEAQTVAGSTDRTAAGGRSPSRLNQKAGRPNVRHPVKQQ